MSELSQGAYLAWRLAAGETARALHSCIEKEFLVVTDSVDGLKWG